VFYENNTYETWRDAKDLGGLDELEANRPKVKPIVSQMYSLFSELRRETPEKEKIKRKDIEKAVNVLNYEIDKAIEVIQAADDYYMKLVFEKLKRMAAK
jgi:hypothetical protein